MNITILKLWTLIKNIIESTHKFPYDILFTLLMECGRAPNGIGHLMIAPPPAEASEIVHQDALAYSDFSQSVG